MQSNVLLIKNWLVCARRFHHISTCIVFLFWWKRKNLLDVSLRHPQTSPTICDSFMINLKCRPWTSNTYIIKLSILQIHLYISTLQKEKKEAINTHSSSTKTINPLVNICYCAFPLFVHPITEKKERKKTIKSESHPIAGTFASRCLC